MPNPARRALFSPTENDVAHDVDLYLALHDGAVFKFSQDCAVRRQLAGWPDRVFVSHECLLFVELKRPGGVRRPAQVKFFKMIEPYLCSWLRYVCASDVADVAAIFGDEVI